MFKNKALIPIAVVVVIDLIGFTIIIPMIPFYAAQFGASSEMVGYILASYSVCQFFAGPVLGGLSDKFGRRPLLIYSQIGSMIGFILLAVANSIPILFLSRIIDGISGGNVTIASAYIADVTKPEERSQAMAIIGIAFGVGFVIGMPIGGVLAQHFGYAVPAMVGAAFALSSTLLSTFYLKEHHHVRDESTTFGFHYYTRIIEYLRIPSLRMLLLTFLFFVLPFTLFMSMFSLFAMIKLNFTPEDIGLFLGFVGVLGILWQGGVIRPLVKNLGEIKSLRLGLAAMTVGHLGLAFSQTVPTLIIVAVILSFGTGVTRPVISSLISQHAPPNRKGGALGVSSSLESFSRAITPILGGWLIGALHPNWLLYVAAVFSTIAVLLAFQVTGDSHTIERSYSSST